MNPNENLQRFHDRFLTHQRVSTRECTFEEFCKYLYAAVYKNQYIAEKKETKHILEEIYKMSKDKNGIGVDGIVFARDQGFLSFEDLLNSDLLSEVVTQFQAEPRWGDPHLPGYYYSHVRNSKYLSMPFIKNIHPKKPTISLPSVFADAKSEEEPSKKSTTIQGEIFSYETEGTSSNQDTADKPHSSSSQRAVDSENDEQQKPAGSSNK